MQLAVVFLDEWFDVLEDVMRALGSQGLLEFRHGCGSAQSGRQVAQQRHCHGLAGLCRSELWLSVVQDTFGKVGILMVG